MSDQLSFDLSGTAPETQPLQLKLSGSATPSGKLCSGCGEWKLKEVFGKNRKQRDGLNVYCLDCARKQTRKAQTKMRHTPKIRLFDLPKKCLMCKQTFPPTAFNKDSTQKDGLARWCRECSVSYYKDNHYGKSRAKLRNKYRDDEEYRDGVVLRMQNIRAKRLKVPGVITVEEWQALKAEYNYHCAYCGYKPVTLEVDHFWPITWYKRGFSKAVNDVSNIFPACKYCNRAKQDYNPFEFLAWKNGLLQAA